MRGLWTFVSGCIFALILMFIFCLDSVNLALPSGLHELSEALEVVDLDDLLLALGLQVLVKLFGV